MCYKEMTMKIIYILLEGVQVCVQYTGVLRTTCTTVQHTTSLRGQLLCVHTFK
jgi:hypothetical protein